MYILRSLAKFCSRGYEHILNFHNIVLQNYFCYIFARIKRFLIGFRNPRRPDSMYGAAWVIEIPHCLV
jgi:hypothetical protein